LDASGIGIQKRLPVRRTWALSRVVLAIALGARDPPMGVVVAAIGGRFRSDKISFSWNAKSAILRPP